MSAAWNSANSRPVPTGYTYSIRGGPAPRRPPREYLDAQQRSNAAAHPPRGPPARYPVNRDSLSSNFRPASSVYSQSSPVDADFSSAAAPVPRPYSSTPDDISPPSSPEPTDPSSRLARRGRSRDVSPLGNEQLAVPQRQRVPSRNARRDQDAQNPGDDDAVGRGRSNIPMMRRARRKQSDAALREAQSRERLNAAAQQNQRQQEPQQPRAGQHRDDVRWDGMTGEPTGSPAGIPPQVRPADYAQGLGIRASPSPPQQQRSPTSGITSFGDRVRQMVQTGKGERKAEEATSYRSDPAAGAFTSSRPGWRGASGRTALVEPVRDNLQVAPLKIPEKSLRIPEKSSKRLFSPTTAKAPRTESPSQSASPNEQLSPPGPPPGPAAGSRETVRRVVPSSQIAPPVGSSEDTPEADASGSQRKQLSPSSDRFVGVDASATAPRVSAPQETQINRGPDHQRMPIRRKPAPSAEPANEGGHPEQSSELPNDAWVQPPSRFSITTYATSTAETPRASLDDLPPMPTPPQQYLSGSSPANLRTQGSVMDRKRPKIGGGAYDGDDKVYSTSSGEPIVISLKDEFTMSSPFSTGDRKTARPPAQQQQQQQQRQPNLVTSPTHSGGRPSSTASGQLAEKSLPPAPPETTADRARDRVGLLNARLTALGNRRINLTRSIQQMTELMPRDHVLDSAEVIRKREAERRKVEALRSELADVRREEYEIGLQLHRVYKRLDREAQWDSTSLWVRRVTE